MSAIVLSDPKIYPEHQKHASWPIGWALTGNFHAHRFGNRVIAKPLSQTAFTAEGSGPGELTATISQGPGSELAVKYAADIAGSYLLAVQDSSTGEVCPCTAHRKW